MSVAYVTSYPDRSIHLTKLTSPVVKKASVPLSEYGRSNETFAARVVPVAGTFPP